MKKLLASLLAMVMALSLAAPAFADGPDGPPSPAPDEDPPSGWTADDERAELAEELGFSVATDYSVSDDVWEWIAAHKEETRAFLADIDSYIEAQYGDWGLSENTLDGFAQTMGMTRDGALLYVLEDWVWEQQSAEEYAAFREANPELIAQFEADAYDYFAKEYDGWDSVEEYMEYYDLTEAEFVDAMVDEQIDDYLQEQSYQEWLDEFEASHPGMIAWFEANAYDYFAQKYYYWDSAEKYMELHGCTEEEFVADMVEAQIYELLYKEEQQVRLDQMKTELGGVPGQIGVMIDGEYVKFPDAAPELTNGRTMAPLRAVMEALGAKVTYNSNDDIRCTVNGVEYTFAVGSTAVNLRYVDYDGEGDAPDMEGLIMDCAPYIRNGRTYVPVRFFAEALGYTVEWDGDFKTAVLTDMDGLAESIDKDFTILNKLLAKRQLPDAYKASVGCTGALTIFNTIDGDRNSSMTVSQELTASPAGMSGTVKYDLSGLLELFREEYGAELLDETDEEQLAALKALLSGTVEVRMDQESGTLYLSMPAMTALMEQLGVEAPKDAWFSMDAGELDLSELGVTGQDATMGALIAASAYGSYAVYNYSEALEAGKAAAGLLGDKQFTRKGDAMTLSVDKAKLEACLAALDGDDYSYYDMPREFSLTLTVKDSGAAEYSLVYRTPAWDRYYGDSEDMRVTLSGSGDGLNADMKLEIHMKNQYKLALTVKQTAAETTEQPQTTPPAGSVVIPIDGGDAYPGLDGLDPDFTIPMEFGA